ncbi:hypothetical protein DJ532_02745 [Sulfolobus sp. A20-N-F8]|uniref:hypothetical protein n=1 Tax=Saccharolobus sp. A20 TaxID=1891280 RepID=UPI0009F4370B|nr:hypothetical protein [Sulfolobus sp. A20]TRM74312.1 hypothetical protein DJ523_05170 [Sulfolobus sp. E5]TRM77978.1 hypothetical protein DJ532_02745 [Sulfolobus sp. A20-N-F8]TRM96928.1 hypothetical protein DJ527_12360 [Sulfolobus sp. F1]
MKIYNLGRSFVLTGIIELIISSILYTKNNILTEVLGDYTFYCLLLGTLLIIISLNFEKN